MAKEKKTEAKTTEGKSKKEKFIELAEVRVPKVLKFRKLIYVKQTRSRDRV